MCNDKWVMPAKSLPKGTISLGASFPLMLQLNVIHLFLLHKVKNPFTDRSRGKLTEKIKNLKIKTLNNTCIYNNECNYNMYWCESLIIKKAEHWRTDALELWSWRRLLRVPWTARPNQSILKEINPGYLLEGLMLKLQYLGHLTQRADSLEKTLILGKIEVKRRRGGRGWDG